MRQEESQRLACTSHVTPRELVFYGYNQNWELHLLVQNIVQQFSKTAHLKASNIFHSEEDCS